MSKVFFTILFLILTVFAPSASHGAIQLSPQECLVVYGRTAYDIAVQRDQKVSKETFLKEYMSLITSLGISKDDEAVLIVKDLVDYIYLSKNKSKEEIFEEKASQCLSQKGILRKNESL